MEPSNSLTEFSAAARQLSKELLFTHFRYIFGSFPPECPSPSALLSSSCCTTLDSTSYSAIVATRETVVPYLQQFRGTFYDPTALSSHNMTLLAWTITYKTQWESH